MNRILLLALLCATALAAVDLTGEWRRQEGDDPRWAAPDFDDRDWPRAVMPLLSRPGPTYWLRRQVVLTEPIAEPGLALGMFAQRYDVYLDGVKVAVAHPPAANAYFRPRWFTLPAGPLPAGATVTLAIRVEANAQSLGFYRGLPDLGPYLLTTPEEARKGVELSWLRHQHALLLTELAAYTQLLSALLLALFWLSGVRRPDLAWFAIYQSSAACFNGLMLTSAYRDIDMRWPMFMLVFTLTCLATALARHSGGTARTSWIIAAVSGAPLLAGLFSGNWALPSGLLALVSFAPFGPILVWAVNAWRQGGPGRMVALPLSGYLVFTINTYLESSVPGWPLRSSFFAGPFQVWVATWISAIFGITVGLIMVQEAARERREKARLAREMEAARTVQQLLIPAVAPPGIDAVYLPAAEVGGDFWHYSEGLLVVGDVSGKGLKAAMVVSLITGMLDRRHSTSPAAVLAELNRALHARLDGGFVTCCVLRIDGEGHAVVASAGHPAPYVDGAELTLPAGLPLGMVPEAEYEETSLGFQRQLTLVSDGVVEAENAQRELFGFDRTRAISTQSAQEIAEAAQQWGQNDDITVVTVTRRSA